MAELSKEKFGKLKDAVRGAHSDLRWQRESRVQKIRQFVGDNYSQNGSETQVPVNMLELMITTYKSNLVTANPKSLVTTKVKDLRPSAYNLKLALDNLSEEINLKETVSKCVDDSFFLFGIAKVGLNYSKTIEFGDAFHDIGQPFADWVGFDDFVFDTEAYSIEKCAFVGDRVRLPLESVKKCGLYDKSVVAQLTPEKSIRMTKGQEEGQTASKIGQPQESTLHQNDYQEKVQLWNIYLPQENLIVTMADEEGIDKPLAVVEWKGPEHGPYRYLKYIDVPGNIIPLSPVSLMYDLHVATNKLYNKVIRQSLRQKTLLGYKPGSRDAKRIVDASDGEGIEIEDPNSAKEFRFGGPDQANMLFSSTMRQLFSYSAGNLDAMGGLGAQADTVGQEEIIKSSTTLRLKHMQTKVEQFVKGIFEDLAFYLWYDPLINLPLVKEVAGYQVHSVFNAETREGDFLQYNINIEPYSLKDKTPSEKVQEIFGTIERIAPFIPTMQQQGITVDMENIINIVADYSNLPELKEIFMTADGDAGDYRNKQTGDAPPKIQNMNKQYNHTYTSRGSLNGMENVMNQQMLMKGMQQNQQEMAM